MAVPLIIFAGPTAVGKSDLAAEIALKINGEIISADSMQIYKLMNIGTAKPNNDIRSAVRHHLIDIVYPDEEYSVALYRQDAIKAIEQIYRKGKFPIMVGGTGLYINSVINTVDYSIGPDHNFRKSLEDMANKNGLDYLYNMLLKVDPTTAATITTNDKKRIIRALEVFYKTGKPISYYKKISGNKTNNRYNLFFFGLNMERNMLYSRIEKRVDEMIKNGLIYEVEKLLSMGYNEQLNSMQAIGYKQIAGYLNGQGTIDETIQIIKRDTRHYAKRQLTWFRKDERIEWIYTDKLNRGEIIKNIIEKLAGIYK